MFQRRFDVAELADVACPEDKVCYQNWRLILCLLVIWCFICFSFTRKINYKSKVGTLSGILLYGSLTKDLKKYSLAAIW